MNPTDFLQFGAMGLLGLTLFWLRKAADHICSSVKELSDELKDLRREQGDLIRVLTLVVSRELGEAKTAKVMKPDGRAKGQRDSA